MNNKTKEQKDEIQTEHGQQASAAYETLLSEVGKSPAFIDRDWEVNGKCKYYKWPSCHPMQTGPEDIYVCSHSAWPQNKYEFAPVVQCGGDHKKCQLGERAKYYRRGLKVKINNAKKKIEKWEKMIKEIDDITLANFR